MSEDQQNSDRVQPGEKKKSGRCLVWLLVIGLLPFIIYGMLVGVGAVLIVADPIEAVDAVVVLSGDDGDRLALAVEMHKQGKAPNLVITSTVSAANQRLKNEAVALGFPAASIFITDARVDSTVDEARAVLQLAQQKGWDKLMVVTDPFHSFRARFIFRREMRSSGVEILVRPVSGHWFRSPSWFFHPQGWVFVFLETIKFFSYLLGF